MDDATIDDIAARLASARRGGRLIPLPDAGWPPADLETAERISDRAAAAIGEPVAGWKIGATSPEAQAIIGCNGPFFGPMFAFQITASGGTLAPSPGLLGVECEFAFRIGRDQPAGRGGWDRQSIGDLVESCHPALEIIARRTAGSGFPGFTPAVADFALNAGFVHGPAIVGWREADLAGTAVLGLVDGRQTNAGFGRNVLGHPLEALAWLANALAARRRGLVAGQWVSTGTCLGVVPAQPGSIVSGDFGPLGTVSVRLGG
jgi:2-keto-4-pentenoate hydratase